MKKVFIVLLFASILCNPGYAQQPIKTYLDFENNEKIPEFIKVYADSTEQNNLWQVGHPSKTGFNYAFKNFRALMTDTINSYPVNNTSTFYIEIPKTLKTWEIDTLNHVVFEFPYKLDTDTLHDFGRIEMSLDGGDTYFEITPDSTFFSYFNSSNYVSSGTTGKDWAYISLFL